MRNLLLLQLMSLLPTLGVGQQAPRFANGLPTDPSFFPIGVWLQAPHNAKAYAELGINVYVGLWDGPTKEQLDALDKAGMRVICHQNEVGLAHKGKTIVAWMHGDEPDNAQGRRLSGYAPPIAPAQIVADYERLHRADATRPILLNLGQGAAWDGWHGRGERTNHPEDYPEYVKGCDLVSFDIYPVTHTHRDVKGRLEFVGRGVQRLVDWTRGQKPVWACIETGHVNNATVRPTAEQVRSEVWVAVCSGASGIVYFVHEFAPKFVEAGLLAYPEIAEAVRQVDTELLWAAPALATPQLAGAVTTDAGMALALRVHEHDGALHVFAASLQPERLRITFTVHGKKPSSVGAVPEKVGFILDGDKFRDELPGYGFRRYRIAR